MNQVLVAEKKKQTVLDGRFFKSLGMSNKKGPDGKGMISLMKTWKKLIMKLVMRQKLLVIELSKLLKRQLSKLSRELNLFKLFFYLYIYHSIIK